VDVRLSDEQSTLQEHFRHFFEREATIAIVREAEPFGFDGELWKKLLAMGVVAMGIPIESGGDGVSLLDLTIVAEEFGASMAPAPLIEALVGARLLSQFRSQLDDGRWGELLDGRSAATAAFRPFLGGTSRLVPAGAVADVVVGLDRDQLVLVNVSNAAQRTTLENLGCSPLADVATGGEPVVLADGARALEAMAQAKDEWKVLTAAALVGLAQKSHDIGLDYVKNRKVFGAVVGSFQTVAHHLADDIVQIDGSRLLVREGAWSADEGTEFSSQLISAGFAYAAETATTVTAHSLHFHGGSGYIMEQDIQMYFRRAKAWPLVYGDPRREYQVVADKTWGERGQR
jgi:alkylation response protein AidB-like acyl-CoA dehydrogenase